MTSSTQVNCGVRCIGVILAVATACRAPADEPRPLDRIAEGYVRASLGLAQHQPELVDEWQGPAEWRPGSREPVATTHEQITGLADALARIDHDTDDARQRASYLRGQLDALDLAARRLLGESMTFAEELQQAFGVPVAHADVAEAQGALSAALPGAGPVRDRHEAWRRRYEIPADRRKMVLHAAIDACRGVTRAHIALPPDEAIELRLGVDTPWDGLARSAGPHRSTIEASGRGSMDVSRALTLACHEAYPGHHVQHVLVEDALVHDRGWIELALTPRFGRHLLVAEGAAEAGVDLAMPPEVRRRIYRERLFPLAGLAPDTAAELVDVEERIRALDIAIPAIVGSYLDSRASREETLERLGDAGVLDPDTFLQFAERRRAAAVVYPIGRRAVLAYLHRGGDPWARLVALFTDGALSLD